MQIFSMGHYLMTFIKLEIYSHAMSKVLLYAKN